MIIIKESGNPKFGAAGAPADGGRAGAEGGPPPPGKGGASGGPAGAAGGGSIDNTMLEETGTGGAGGGPSDVAPDTFTRDDAGGGGLVTRR